VLLLVLVLLPLSFQTTSNERRTPPEFEGEYEGEFEEALSPMLLPSAT
jgi:hypothetical protein